MATTTSSYGVPTTYVKRPTSIAEYSMMRGVTDFTNASQFNLYEKSYSYLFVLAIPKYIEELGKLDTEVKRLTDAFCNIIQYEFKGASGFDDITTEDLEITDGISTLNVLGKVVKQSTAEISTTYTEKSSVVLTNFTKYYLEGIRDPRTQAKTYHGLIKAGKLAPGFENEIFTLFYIVTDNTLMMLQKSYLMCNAYPTNSKQSIHESERGSVEKVDVEISWRCFLVDGDEVDKRAVKLLAKINTENAVANAYTTMDKTLNAASISAANDQTKVSVNSTPVNLDYNTTDYDVLDTVDTSLEK